jgi:uncharacterized protein (DUF983 family)
VNAIPDPAAFARRLYRGNSFHPPRPILSALLRGFAGVCPACGQGALFKGYLKRRQQCPHCGEALHHGEPDGLSGLIAAVAALTAACALSLLLDAFVALPLMLQTAVCAAAGALAALGLLPKANGLSLALAWAVRLRGFDPEERVLARKREAASTENDQTTWTRNRAEPEQVELACHPPRKRGSRGIATSAQVARPGFICCIRRAS